MLVIGLKKGLGTHDWLKQATTALLEQACFITTQALMITSTLGEMTLKQTGASQLISTEARQS